MDYIEVNFNIDVNSPEVDILIAQLGEIGFESFMELDEGLLAYVPVDNFNESQLNDLLLHNQFNTPRDYTVKTIKEQNWNKVWESNYDPVIIKDQIYIRAPFHDTIPSYQYEILVDPKMSFGTAHHETTSLMIEMMLDEKMTGKNVLDMGCGTGILAIFAEMLGAKEIDAIDFDEWATDNATENVEKNKCKNIHVKLGNVSNIKTIEYDYILANINRNVLLQDISVYVTHLVNNGILLLSGFYTEDLKLIESSARANNMKFDRKLIKNNWVVARFVKN